MNPVEEVKSRLDIVDVISKHVDLKRAGRNYKALCPFHSEKTPSFIVFPDTQTWRCFGACAEGGDVFSFLMKMQGWDFGETLRVLAEQTGVELKPRSKEQVKRQEAYARLYELLDAAAIYYMHLLRNAPEAEGARRYVGKRGLWPETVERFQLGYALDQWEGASKYLQDKGYTQDELLTVGLLVEKEETGRRYDRFRGRLLIPIRDLRGRVVGFGARTLQPDVTPKYLNSPQTDLFDKSTLLFGLDMAKKGVREAGQAVVVEGYMDVIQGQQAGFTNLVAQMGTALTEAQVRRLKRYTSRLVLALDADAAGQSATLRGLNVARQTLDREVEVVFDPRGLVRHEARLQADIRIATLPEGYDPDKLIKKDPDAWLRLVDGARPVVEYIIDAIIADVDPGDAKSKSVAATQAVPIIRDIANAVERDHYTQYLARHLGIDERTLTGMVTQPLRPIGGEGRRVKRRAWSVSTPSPPPVWDGDVQVPPGDSSPHAADISSSTLLRECHCLNQLITIPAAWRQADTILRDLGFSLISVQDFSDPQNRAIFKALRQVTVPEHLREGNVPHDLWEALDEALHPRLDVIREQLLPAPDLSDEKVANHLAYTVLRMRKDATEQAKRALDQAWGDSLSEQDRTSIGEYHQQVLELRSLRLHLDRALEQIINPIINNND